MTMSTVETLERKISSKDVWACHTLSLVQHCMAREIKLQPNFKSLKEEFRGSCIREALVYQQDLHWQASYLELKW